MPHFEVQACFRLTTTIADRCDGVTGLNPFTHLFIQTFIITVQAHIPLSMIDYYEVSKPA